MKKLTTSFYNRFAWIRLGLYLSALTLFCGWAQSSRAATLTTDRLDYPPFSDVTLTGTGFGPKDAVTVAISEVNADGSRTFVQQVAATADPAGSFTATWYIFSDEFGGALLEAIATGNPSGATATVLFSDTGPGTPLLSPPTGGFGIDGDLYANTPTANRGDWAPATGGTGGNVLDASGNPLNGATTFHLTDPFASGTDNNFAGGNKVNDNPNTWTWVSNPVGDKVDMNNALLHFTTDGAGDTWLVMAADRLSDNGDAYIDFEFLQRSLTVTTTPGSSPPAGGFVSAGLDGGRTVNDFILTVSLTKGGSTASFFVERWQAVGAGYNYVDYAPPVGDTFAAVNTAVISSPYPAFGGSTYAINTFAEAAVNLTKLIGSFNPCLSLGIKTVLVKTKVSQSPTAGMVDFISPLQVSLTLGVANAGHDQSKCSEGTSTSFALSGAATPSPGQTVSSTTWSVVPGTGTATIDTPGSLNTSVAVGSPSVTMRLTVATVQGCIATNDVVLTVLPTPTCSIIGETVLYAGTIGATYQAPADAGSYSWSLAGDAVDNGFLTDISGETSPTLSFNIAGGASGSFTVTLNRTGENGCISTCFKPVEIQPLEAGCLIDGPLTACAGQQNVEYNLHAVGSATSITWSLNPNTSGAAFDPTPAPMAETVFVDAGVAGSYTVNVTVIYPGGTLNCFWETTVNALPACSITGPVGPVCPNSSGNIYSVPEGPDGTLYAWTIDGGSIVGSSTGPSVSVTAGSTCGSSFTLNVTVSFPSGCHTACTKTVSVIDTTAPTPPAAPATVHYECEALVPPAQTLTATDNCEAIITGVPTDSRNGADPCHVIITRRWTFTDACGNSSFVEQTINVSDTTAPTPPAAPATVHYECEALVPPAQTLTAADNCEAIITGVPTDSRNGADPCHVIITRRWTFTDPCGNSSFVEQTINVSDTTAPTPPAAPATVHYECEALVPPAQTLTAADNCGAIITGVPTDSRNGADPCHVIITRRWTFTDPCGNSSFVEQTINVSDTTAPTPPAAPATEHYECEALVPPSQTLTATDNCGAIITGVPTDSRNGADPCHVIITRRWTFTDACGNSSFVEQTINVSDTTAPTPPAAPATVHYECEALVPPAQTLTATDNCEAIITGVPTDSRNGADPCHVIITRRWTFTDACGNSSFVEQTINVSDTTAPTPPAAPATVHYECEALVPPAQTLTATDNCGAIITGVPTDSRNGADPCHLIITRRWTFTDACGNSSFVEQTINVIDDTAPTPPAAPATEHYECEALVPPAQTLTATDNCGTITGVPTDSRNGADPCHVIITRRWTFTDACGNSSFVEQTITVSDDTAPTPPAAPATEHYECEALVPPAQTLTATDNCGTITGVPTDSRNGADPCHVIITRRWTFTDPCGNSSFVEQTITVNDTTAPTPPAAPATVHYECEALVPPAQTLTATDNCEAIITGVPTDSRDGADPCHLIITRRWTFTDACGNSSFVEQTITVSDTTAPTPPAAPATVHYECEALVPPAQTLTATDNCGAIITGVPTDSRNGADPCHLIITRRWTFTDACGNSSFVEQTINVSDTTAPTPPTAPATVHYECEALVPPAQTLTATDNCGAIITGVPTDSRNGADPCHLIITRRWTFTDACGNSSFVEQTINVSDTTAPTPPAVPATVHYECEALVPPAQTLTATDNCGAIITGVPTDSRNGANPCHVIITRRWTFTDACGNSSFVEQTINVTDDTAPTPPTAPATVHYECEALVPPAQTLTATDNCGAIITGVPTDSRNGANPCHVIITRRWTFTDPCGNSSFVEQTINVSDTTAPTPPAAPATVHYECEALVPPAQTLTATDNCGAIITGVPTDSRNSGDPCHVIITRRWTFTDACGNSSFVEQTINVSDTTAPTPPTAPATVHYECEVLVPPAQTLTATDNCGATITGVPTDSRNSGDPCHVIITRRWTFTDACGNSSFVEQTITVSDTTAPVLSGCPAVTTSFRYQCLSEVPAAPAVTATDNCDRYVPVYFNETQSNPGSSCNNVITRTWTATDRCGNPASCTQTITVNDTTSPVLNGYPAPTLYVQCVGEVPEPAYVTANDNCARALTPDFTETSSGSACDKTITRTWTAQDACGNSASRSQVIHVKDTKAPVINCPKDYIAHCGTGKCGTNPELTGKATATDNCDGDVPATYTDSGTPDPNGCEWTVYRTWTAKDACGNTSTCVQKIMCVPYSKAIVTDSSLCTYDWDPSTTCREFRLLFTPYGSGYKLNASNPGQTYYNVFYVAPAGMPAGTPITLTLTIPYPYVTQGANPIHAYDDVDVTGPNPTFCLVNLGNPVPITSVTPAPPITLGTYGTPPAGPTTMTVTMPLPASGFIYLNMHLDYGLKGTYGYSKGGPSGNDAVSQTTAKVVIPDKTNYVFSVGGDVTDTDGICNMNVFKKNPGVGGRCGYRYTLDGVSDIIATPNATVTLKDSKGALLTTGKTDEDGWYMLSYKWTGKAATLIVTVQPVGKPAQSKSITLKANGFVEVNFDVP